MKKIWISALLIPLAAGAAALTSRKNIEKLVSYRNSRLPGNGKKYDFTAIEPLKDSPLQNKKIAVLGSSVAYGAASEGNAVGEYLSFRFNASLAKEAVSGTTLADTMPGSYVRRIQDIPAGDYDLFICQLSTNDATRKLPLGTVSEGQDITELDLKTITGALEYIILYARRNFGCPAAFFTGSHYDSERYDEMVKRLYELKDKYGFIILDLWNEKEFNDIPDDLRKLYMADPIHPTKAGYRDWWGPEIEKQLLAYFSDKSEAE